VRFISLFKKTMIENFRDWKILILTLTMAPFFVVLMKFYFEETAQTAYRVIVVNQDQGATTIGQGSLNAGQALISEMTKARYPEGTKILEVEQEEEMFEAQSRLENNSADLVVEIPIEFSKVLLDYNLGNQPPPAVIRTYGNPANTRYMMAAVWSDTITYAYSLAVTGLEVPLELQARTIQGSKSLNDFDLYVPGLLGLAVISMMFTAAASLIYEKDKGTLIRLRISNMTPFEWLSAVSLTQVIIGLLAVALTFLTALALGYQTSGSVFALLVIALLSSLSIMAISLLVAAFLRTIFDLMTIGCFPFFILMFFSGGLFPLPPLRIFTVGSRSININDILPTTHTISAMDKILNCGAGLSDVAYELGAIVILSVVYFSIGAWLFGRRHLRASQA
jgi:ABC-2 type transport system permease protein